MSIKFKKDLAKKIEQQTIDDNAPADSRGIEIKSPAKMFWFRIKGESYEDIIKVQTTRIPDTTGQDVEYLIFCEDPKLRNQIIAECDDKVSTKALCRCVNWFGQEFLWLPTIKNHAAIGRSSGTSAINAIELGQQHWIKVQWKNQSWNAWKHSGTDKLPEWSNMSDEDIVNTCFKDLIISDLKHEALTYNQKG